MTRVLLLGGTAEGRALAKELHPHVEIVSSLAGRVPNPALPIGPVRIGGFGGVEGLRGWLREERIDAVVDATHPFAVTITAHAAQVCGELGLPYLVLARPPWDPGTAIIAVSDIEAADVVAEQGYSRVFLTTGRSGIAAFANSDAWFLIAWLPRPMAPPCRGGTNWCYLAGHMVTTMSSHCCVSSASTHWSPRTAVAR